ncbi:rhomboid family intramembrane serine protease [Streptosporangium sp. NPDC002721]|uniref:rhomboid family intramembrane serine protease n=1 Tax=Streptosporangium sp. NPDC002721 TaxID=3366188 RepID=UPI0036833F00
MRSLRVRSPSPTAIRRHDRPGPRSRFLSAYRGVVKFLGVTGLIILVSGLGAWFTSDPQSVGAGASGVVFGYFGYVLVRGAFDRHLIDIVIGVVIALCFSYQFTGLLPKEGIGWQAHLFGFLAGLLGGWLFRERNRTRPAPDPSPRNPRTALRKELDELGL